MSAVKGTLGTVIGMSEGKLVVRFPEGEFVIPDPKHLERLGDAAPKTGGEPKPAKLAKPAKRGVWQWRWGGG